MKWYLSFTDEEVFWGWHSPRRKRRIVCIPFALQTSPRHTVCLSQLQKGEPQSSWDWRKSYIHPNQWWLQRDPPTDQDPEAESGIKPTLPNDTNETASLPAEDPYSTSALPINTSLGISVATNPTAWLLWSNGLFAYSRAHRGGP